MKHTILTLALLSSGAMSADYDNPSADLMYEEANRMSSRPEEPIGSTYNRHFNDSNVVVPIPPSTTGPSYYGPNTVYTQEQNCFKDSTIGVMRCYPR